MKKLKLFKICALLFMLIPCFFAFSACAPANYYNTTNISIDKNFSIKDAYDALVEEGYDKTFSEFIKDFFQYDISQIITDECKPCVVAINRKEYSSKSGSGVFFKIENNSAYIITNYHVVYPDQYTDTFYITLANDINKDFTMTATCQYVSDEVDLAILKIENDENVNKGKVVTFANKNAKDGESCIAIGNTHSKGISVTLGNISKAYDTCEYTAGSKKIREVLMHCAYIEKGSSGGGLFNLAGELIGITNAGESGEITLQNYAIRIETVENFIEEFTNNN